MVGSRPDADELTADVFVKALAAIDSYDESKSSLATWLQHIAHNLAVSHMRRPHILLRSLTEADNPVETEPGEDPRIDLLHTAIARLGYKERALLHMYYFEDAGAAEIAYVTGISAGAVMVRLHRLRLKLKKMIDEYGR